MKTFFGVTLALALIALSGAVGSASAKPGWAVNECLIDDGYNRYSSCNSGD